MCVNFQGCMHMLSSWKGQKPVHLWHLMPFFFITRVAITSALNRNPSYNRDCRDLGSVLIVVFKFGESWIWLIFLLIRIWPKAYWIKWQDVLFLMGICKNFVGFESSLEFTINLLLLMNTIGLNSFQCSRASIKIHGFV